MLSLMLLSIQVCAKKIYPILTFNGTLVPFSKALSVEISVEFAVNQLKCPITYSYQQGTQVETDPSVTITGHCRKKCDIFATDEEFLYSAQDKAPKQSILRMKQPSFEKNGVFQWKAKLVDTPFFFYVLSEGEEGVVNEAVASFQCDRGVDWDVWIAIAPIIVGCLVCVALCAGSMWLVERKQKIDATREEEAKRLIPAPNSVQA